MAFSFLCTLSFLSCLLLVTSSFQTSSVDSVSLPSDSSDKVSLGLYYQSLFEGCAKFVTKSLPLMFENGLISIVDLHLSPWGNSEIVGNKTFVCQGGKFECFLNTVEACAINAWPDVVKHFNFIGCVESLVLNDESSKWETCFDILKLDRTPIDKCLKSGLGTELELKYAKETAALEPPHEFTPWVVVAGEPLYFDIENFMSYICKAYKGSSLPEVCKKLHPPSDKPKTVQVSYRAKAAKFTRSKMIQA